jgi:hypothetical protein
MALDDESGEKSGVDTVGFRIEEYKAIQDKIKQSRDMITRFETLTITGTVITVSVLLGIGITRTGAVPLFAWWFFSSLVIASGIRCWSYYMYQWRLQTIEHYMKDNGYDLCGFETFNRSKAIGPFLIYTLNGFIWVILIGSVVFLSFWTSIGRSVP